MITFTSVTKRFGEDQPALDNVSFDVDAGEFIFLTGHSGSGKTTLLKILTKEYTPTTGEVEFEGKPLSKMRASQVHRHRRSIGVVFQDYRLLPDLNVWENIALALQIIGKKQSEIEERVTDLLELVQLTDKAYNFPAQLSGGESQRIGIARALATAPSVLLADEPTGNLDPQNTLMIARLFDRINQLGTTVLFATHDTNILNSLQHRRLVLEKGKLVSDSGAKAKKPVDKPQPAVSTPQSLTKPEVKVEAPKPASPSIKNEPPRHVASDTTTIKPENPTAKLQPATSVNTKPKRSFLHLPKISFPFGKKKVATQKINVNPGTLKASLSGASTQAPLHADASKLAPVESASPFVPQIKQENLDDDKPLSLKPTPKKEDPKKKLKKDPEPVIEVETLQALLEDESKD